jgi:hypothetical protein
MRPIVATLLTIVPVVATTASTQTFAGYVTAGSGSIDYLVYRETIPQVSAGVLFRPKGDRFRIGGEADIFTSNGYYSGRGGPFAEFALVTRGRIQPFVRGGYFVGEDDSWIAGGGVDLWLLERGGIRVCVQDAFRILNLTYGNPGRHVAHEPSVQIGWVWK